MCLFNTPSAYRVETCSPDARWSLHMSLSVITHWSWVPLESCVTGFSTWHDQNNQLWTPVMTTMHVSWVYTCRSFTYICFVQILMTVLTAPANINAQTSWEDMNVPAILARVWIVISTTALVRHHVLELLRCMGILDPQLTATCSLLTTIIKLASYPGPSHKGAWVWSYHLTWFTLICVFSSEFLLSASFLRTLKCVKSCTSLLRFIIELPN